MSMGINIYFEKKPAVFDKTYYWSCKHPYKQSEYVIKTS